MPQGRKEEGKRGEVGWVEGGRVGRQKGGVWGEELGEGGLDRGNIWNVNK